MKYSPLALTMASALGLAISGVASAADMKNMDNMEKCQVVKDGKGQVKAGKGDCKSDKNSCAGQNTMGEKESWIFVPKGECAKVQAGDCSTLPADAKAKLEDGFCK